MKDTIHCYKFSGEIFFITQIPNNDRLPCYFSVLLHIIFSTAHFVGFPGGSDSKETACNAVDPGSIPESGRSPGEGNGNRLQYSCLENPMDRRAWQATVRGSQRVRHD